MAKGERKPRGQAASKSKPRAPKVTFGRPEDDPLQTHFMKKLRQGKLQTINAESQAELACFEHADKHPQYYVKRELKDEDDNYSKQKIAMVREWFKEIDAEKFELLWGSFKQGAEKWEFKEIHSEQDFPEYLFCDECDLSYVLHTALKSDHPLLKNKVEFSSDELFFFEMLCFAARDQISFSELTAFKEHFGEIMSNMQGLKAKIVSSYQANLQRQNEGGVYIQENERMGFGIEQEIPKHLRRGELMNQLMEEDEADDDSNDKEKGIRKKDKKQKKKRGRPNKKEQEVHETDQLTKEQVELVLHKLITHIAWAYRYILPEEINKQNRLKSTQK